LPRQVGSPANLPETCQPRLYKQSTPNIVFVSLNLSGERGSRSDEAHGPQEDIEELWKFIHAVTPENAADTCDPRIISDLKKDTMSLILFS
jgi:hypothetical protein